MSLRYEIKIISQLCWWVRGRCVELGREIAGGIGCGGGVEDEGRDGVDKVFVSPPRSTAWTSCAGLGGRVPGVPLQADTLEKTRSDIMCSGCCWSLALQLMVLPQG